MHGYASWVEERIATSRIDGVVVRLNTHRGGQFPHLMTGRETTHQVGMWTSSLQRPRGMFRYGGDGIPTEMRQLTYVPAGIEWIAEIDKMGPVRPAIFCDFDENYFRKIVHVDLKSTLKQLPRYLESPGSVMQQALSVLVDEVQSPGFAHESKVDSLCRLVLIELARSFGSHHESEQAPTRGKLSQRQLQLIWDYVEASESHALTVSNIAILSGVSLSHLRRLFKATTGTSVTAFIDRVRLERAKALLTDSAIPLKQISHTLGFADPSAFSAAFRRGTGQSPSCFRKEGPYR